MQEKIYAKREKLKTAIRQGGKKGVSGYLWMLRILVPVSVLTLAIEASGLIRALDFILSPVMGMIGLSPTAALPLIVGMLTGIYGGVAALSVLPMSVEEMTLVAVFLLISHNMVVESTVQDQSGLGGLKATIIRIVTSIITVWILSFILVSPETASSSASFGSTPTFSALFAKWFFSTGKLMIQILCIIVPLMMLLETLKIFRVIPKIVFMLEPLLRVLGLPPSVGIMWMAATLFGLAYGAAVIVEESKEGEFAENDLAKLHISIGINHAIVEDPALFLPLGIGAFWLWVPRLIAAVVAVWLYTMWLRLKPVKKVHTVLAP